MFPQLFRVLPNFHECFYNSIETRRTCFLFLLENIATRLHTISYVSRSTGWSASGIYPICSLLEDISRDLVNFALDLMGYLEYYHKGIATLESIYLFSSDDVLGTLHTY